MTAKKFAVEVSAGGVVIKNRRLLLIKVRNLKKEVVWTFPKGHLEKGETNKEAALREVREETGYHCRVTGKLKPVKYWFYRGKQLVKKSVYWFLMMPVKKVGRRDPEEVMRTTWGSLRLATERLTYTSDKNILEQLAKRGFKA